MTGEMQRFVGELEQPMVHQLYRTKFNAVHVFNKLALCPNSCVGNGTYYEEFGAVLAFLAMAETNAYLAYMQLSGEDASSYSHTDYRWELVQALLDEVV